MRAPKVTATSITAYSIKGTDGTTLPFVVTSTWNGMVELSQAGSAERLVVLPPPPGLSNSFSELLGMPVELIVLKSTPELARRLGLEHPDLTAADSAREAGNG